MACCENEICCPPASHPCVTCCMVVPPPIMAPTVPQPVKPLSLPCPMGKKERVISQEEAERTRYANFYNNYNIDWHKENCGVSSACCSPCCPDSRNNCQQKGKNCEDYRIKRINNNSLNKGCPTGFQPCTMKLTPPMDCHPCGVWCAQIQPCPPKPRKKRGKYVPGPCCRPCCKHWRPKDGPCQYTNPCKAHCFNTPNVRPCCKNGL